jgi:hypothetical protein
LQISSAAQVEPPKPRPSQKNVAQASFVTVHVLPSQLAVEWPDVAQRNQSQLRDVLQLSPVVGGSVGQAGVATAQDDPLASQPRAAGQQRTPQTTVSVGHELSHTLATQVESPQASPHDPQLLESLVRSTQLPPQSLSPVAQPPPSAPASIPMAESPPASTGGLVPSSPQPRAPSISARVSIQYFMIPSFST